MVCGSVQKSGQKCPMLEKIQVDSREEQPMLKALGPALLEFILEQTLQGPKEHRGRQLMAVVQIQN